MNTENQQASAPVASESVAEAGGLMTTGELALAAGITRRTVALDMRRGLLAHAGLGRSTHRRGPAGYLFTREEADRYIAYRKTVDGNASKKSGWARRRALIMASVRTHGISAVAASMRKTPDALRRCVARWQKLGLVELDPVGQ